MPLRGDLVYCRFGAFEVRHKSHLQYAILLYIAWCENALAMSECKCVRSKCAPLEYRPM